MSIDQTEAKSGMSIAILTSHAQPLPPYAIGAVEKLFYDLAQVWCDAGLQVTFYSVKGGEQGKNAVMRMQGYKGSGSVYWEIIKDFFYSLRFWFKLKKTDIVILNTFWSPFFARFFKRKFKKVIYGVHRFPKGQFFLYRNVDEFICVSTVVARAVKERFPYLALHVSCINNPIKSEVFNDNGRLDPDGNYTILYAGRIHPEKGIDILVSAFHSLKEDGYACRLVLVGAVDQTKGGGGKEYIMQLRELDKEIEFIPPIYEPEKLAIVMKRADCFAYPSVAAQGEACPVAPLEAMACGLPTVVSDLECFLDYGRPEENILVFKRGKDAANELAVQIRRLMTDPVLADSLGRKAAETAKQFSTDRIAAQYQQHFVRLLNT